MKERRKVKVEEQKKTYYILHLEYSWIREFVKIGIFYTKKNEWMFFDWYPYQENVLEKIKKYSAKKKSKRKKSNV